MNLLNPRSPGNVGRTTRSGNEFSPYILPTGPPVRIETDFDIARALFEHNATHMASEDDGIESEDKPEIDLEGSFAPAPPNPLSSSSQSASLSANNTTHPELTRKQRYAKESRARRRAAEK
jgi:hypothetical protein